MERHLTGCISELEIAWRTMTPEAATEKAKSYIADADRLMDIAPDNSNAFRLANGLHARLGRSCLEKGDTESCMKHFTLPGQYIQRAIDLAPDNHDLLRDASVGKRMMGVLLGSLNRNEEAIESFKAAMAYFQSQSAADPDDLSKQQSIGNTFVLMAKPYYGLGRYAEAIDALEKAESVYEKILSKGDNKYINGVMMQAAYERSNVYSFTGEWTKAFHAAKRTRDLLPSPERTDALAPREVAMIPVVEAIRDAFALVAEQPIPNNQWTPPRIAVALFIVGLDDARRSDSNELTHHATELIAKLGLQNPPQHSNNFMNPSNNSPINSDHPVFNGYTGR